MLIGFWGTSLLGDDDWKCYCPSVIFSVAAKHIPALQLASGEEQQRLAASIEMSKDICASVYKKTLWGKTHSQRKITSSHFVKVCSR